MIVGFTGLLVKCGMRKFAYVGDRLSIVNSGEWACCTVVVRSNLMYFATDVPQIIFFKVQD